MSLYKSKIIKSASVKVVETNDEAPFGAAETMLSAASSNKSLAHERLSHAIREAFERGAAEGIVKGKALQKQANSNILNMAEEAIRQVSRMKAAIIEESEGEILDLVFAIAEKVIHHEATVNKEVVRSVLRSAVEAINERENVKVRCNPEDLAALQDLRPELTDAVDGIGVMEFMADPSILPGGVRVEAGSGEVDARIDKQFEVIKNAVLS
ncbi:MAG: hypothetical protein CSYNP_01209 [Syntrophus sp. SKADARSKE-3]|nr:hypothetical protein [Syntrophus sp. SKADARSKE-3]